MLGLKQCGEALKKCATMRGKSIKDTLATLTMTDRGRVEINMAPP